MSVDPKAIANEFITLAREENHTPLTLMKILKLTYLAHAWSLGLRKKPLSNKSFEAWQFGPVQKELYFDLKNIQNEANYEIEKKFPNQDGALSEDDKELIKAVYKNYSNMDAWELSARTHKEGAPWSTIWDNGKGDRLEIPDALIGQYMLDHHVRKTSKGN